MTVERLSTEPPDRGVPVALPDQWRPGQRRRARTVGRLDLGWRDRLVHLAVAVDVLAIVVPCVVLVYANAFNSQNRQTSVGLVMVLPVLWFAAMNLSRAHEAPFLGLGSEEFKRVLDAAVRVAAIVAIASYAMHAELSRGLLLVAIPSATVLDLLGRYALRKWLHGHRRRGACAHRVLVVGDVVDVAELTDTLRRTPHAGLNVVGACLDIPGDQIPGRAVDVRVLGGLDDVRAVIDREQITAVAVATSTARHGAWLRRLAWSLEGSPVEILVSPGLTDVAGPRIGVRPVAGLPLLRIEQPELSGGHRLLKGVVERSAALAGLLVLLPVLLLIALAIRLTSPGPALFRQVRIGREGREFVLFKFRTMYVDAEQRLADVRGLNVHQQGVLFKAREDPRVTPLGRVLRKYSLDELPQLLNVLIGDMSLVGPRPPLPTEVEQYHADVRRRLLVPPGLTGLWQVSGRADLDWEESVRLDLFYVENWSLALDLMILWKTIPAVLRHTGAY